MEKGVGFIFKRVMSARKRRNKEIHSRDRELVFEKLMFPLLKMGYLAIRVSLFRFLFQVLTLVGGMLASA